MKRILSVFAALLLAFPLAWGQPLSQTARGSITTQNLVAAGTCTAGGCVEIDVRDKGTVTVQVTGTYTASGGLSGQITTDGTTWVTLGDASTFVQLTNLAATATITSAATNVWQVSAIPGAQKFRIAALGAVTGTAVVTLQASSATPASSTSITGGGDASAANQVTGNASLASIDGKLPALASGRVPITDLTAVAQGSTTSGQSGNLIQCATTTSAPTYTNGQTNPVNCDTTGAIRITGSISAGGVAQGSTTSGQTGNLTQGAVTTSAPTYTTGQTNPLSLNTAGGLRVDGSGVTQPVSGTVAATQSGNWTARLADGAGNALTSAARGSERAISVQIVDGSGAQVTSFGGSGGTASNFGSAVPASGTAMGASDGTNMQNPRVADIDTGGGTQYALVVSPRIGASGGGVELTAGAGAVAAGTLRITQASDSPEVAVLGATGDAAATQGGTGSISAKVREMSASLGTINTTLGTINTSINASNSQLPTALGATTASGSLSVTLATDGTNIVSQGSTTSGQRGGLIMGAVTTSAPSYTTAQTSPLSLDTSGNLRVAVTGGAGSTVSGSTAHDAAGAAVNPVATGGYASAAAPTDVSADTDIVRDWNLRSGAKVVQPSFAGVLATTGNGASGTGVQRVTIASDSTGQVALATGSNTIGALTANQSVNVSQINGVTPLMGAGNTGTGSHRVTIATDQAAIATHGHGATGAAVPSGAQQMGVRTGANMEAATQGSTTAAINVSTATTTQLVALASSQQIRVTGLTVVAGGTGNITFVYGTGSNCGTGTTSLSGAIPLVANVGFTMGAGLGPVLIVPASQALCITTSAAVQMSGWITYAQY